MHLLTVLRYNPFPPRAGSALVAYNSLKQLSQIHDIDILCLNDTNSKIEIPDFIKKIEFIYQKQKTGINRLIYILFFLCLGIPPIISEYRSKKLQKRVSEVLKENTYNAILLFEMNAIQYCPKNYYNKIIVNIEDIQSLKSRRMASLSVLSFWQKIKKIISGKIIEHYEKRTLPKIHKVLVLSESDMNEMQQYWSYENISVMPYGVDIVSPDLIPDFYNRTMGMIVLTGNMFHLPNVDGTIYFLKTIFPKILQECPRAKLWIVGAEPDYRIYQVAAPFNESVIITGKVKSISEYLQKAMVSICPIRLKIGVQTKILEALSWGTPVVTTSSGNSGISGISGFELWEEDDPHMFSKRVVELLNGKHWLQLSDNGRKLIEKKFQWHNSINQLNKYIESIN